MSAWCFKWSKSATESLLMINVKKIGRKLMIWDKQSEFETFPIFFEHLSKSWMRKELAFVKVIIELKLISNLLHKTSASHFELFDLSLYCVWTDGDFWSKKFKILRITSKQFSLLLTCGKSSWILSLLCVHRCLWIQL